MRLLGLTLVLISWAQLACRAEVRREVIHEPGARQSGAVEELVVDASDRIAPAWVRARPPESPGEVAFVGSAEGTALEAAKAAALQDLYASISSFVAIDVESSEEDVVEERTGEGGSSFARSTQRLTTRSSATLSEILPDDHYWEKVVASPLAPADGRFRYHLRAWVPRAEITRARIQRQARREEVTSRRTIAVLPFETSGAGEGGGALGAGVAEDLSGLLSQRTGLYVGDPAIVRAVLPGGEASELEAVERVQDALLPDVIVTGSLLREGQRLRVTAVSRDAREGRVLFVRTLERPLGAVRALEAELAGLIASDAGVRQGSEGQAGWPGGQRGSAPAVAPASDALEGGGPRAVRGPQSGREWTGSGSGASGGDPATAEAFEAYHEAYRLFQTGASAAALVKIRRAIELSPQDPAAFLRLGRILERMGRYARLPPTAAVLAQRVEDVRLCTDRGRAAAERAKELLAERAARLASGAPVGGAAEPWWSQDTMLLDPILDAACRAPLPLSRDDAGRQTLESLRRRSAAQSAAEAYVEARLLAREQGDSRGEVTAALALADLAVRADRLDHAHSLYLDVEARALEDRDEHHRSLALAGQGTVLRQVGDLAGAKVRLLAALELRTLLGDKPYLLELFNALGGLAVEAGALAEAEGWYRRARRIAEELGNDYLRAVLANNASVLEHNLGRTSEALAHAEDAFEVLGRLRESEGLLASGLNVALFRHVRGDLAGATAALDRAAEIAAETAQEGRLADLSAKRGALAASRGELDEAELHLATAYFLFRGLGRPVQMARAQNSLLATELSSLGPEPDPEVLSCLERTYWSLGALVFVVPRVDPRVKTVITLGPGVLQDHELTLALNAASLVPLHRWVPPAQFSLVRAPPRPLVDRRVPPPPPPPLGLDERPEPDYEAPTREEVRVGGEDAERPPSRPAPPAPGAAERPRLEVTTSQDRDVATETAAGAAISEKAEAEAVAPVVSSKPAEYERILGAFVADAEVFVWLDPRLAERLDRRDARVAARMLAALAERFEQRAQVRPRAIALLNLAAIEWSRGQAVPAYERAALAARLFGGLADLEGLAHAEEWLGYMFRESGDGRLAGEHLRLAHALYRRLEDRAGMERTLSYGTGG